MTFELAATAVLNAAWMAVFEYMAYPGGAAGTFFHACYELLPAYSVYVLAGCYAATHLDRLQGWLGRYGAAGHDGHVVLGDGRALPAGVPLERRPPAPAGGRRGRGHWAAPVPVGQPIFTALIRTGRSRTTTRRSSGPSCWRRSLPYLAPTRSAKA